MTTSTTTASTSTSSVAAADAAPSPVELDATVRPRVVGLPAGRLVALVVALVAALCLGVIAVVATSAQRDAAPAVPARAAAAPPVVGDTAHGGPGSWADAVRPAATPREDDRAVVAHGGAGRIVTAAGSSLASAVDGIASAG